MYDIVSSPNHVFVSCHHTRPIKVSKCYWFQGSFSSGFDNFSPAGLFQKLAKPCEGVWPCIDGLRFSCALRRYDSEVFDGDFLPSKNEGKDLYVQRKKCHRSGYFSHIENFSCEQRNEPDVDSLGSDGCVLSGPQEDCKTLRYSIFDIQKFWISNIEYRSVLQSSYGPLRKQPSHPRKSTSGSSNHKEICIILFENNRY